MNKRCCILVCAALAILGWTGAARPAESTPDFLTLTVPVTLLPDERFFPRLVEAIGAARKEISITTYTFTTSGRTSNLADRLAASLAEAAGRKVKVTVILEQDSFDRELTDSNRKTGRWLTAHGVSVLYDNPKVKAHAKVAVIDRRWSFIGSHNLSDSALGHNRELSLLIDSPSLAEQVLAYLNTIAAH